MITLTRKLAKQLRAVIKLALQLRGQLPSQPVVLQAGPSGMTVQAQRGDTAITYHQPGNFPTAGLTVPFTMLKEIEGTRPDPVTLTATSDHRIIATWQDGSVPRSKTDDALDISDAPAFPAAPTEWVANDARLLSALAAAMDTTDAESSRYALGCIQLCGKGGVIAATDGRQLLEQTGYRFPFEEELLVRGTKVFANKDFVVEDAVQVGKTDSHVVFRVGPWTLFLAIEKEGRFPRIDDVIPAETAARTTIHFDPADLRFLVDNIPRLPPAPDMNSAVTVDANGRVAVRARTGDEAPTELVLSNSSKDGLDVALAMDRRFLQRAVELGLSRLHVFGQDGVSLCQDDHRSYVWMGLSKDAIVPKADAVEIRSPVVTSPSTYRLPTRRHPVSKRNTSASPASMQPTIANSTQENAQRRGSTTLPLTTIQQAEQLRGDLRQALTSASELVRAIKRQKRQERVYKSALATLRQLQNVA